MSIENHWATAPSEVWNAYNNDTRRDPAWRAQVQTAGITAYHLRTWNIRRKTWRQVVLIALRLAKAPEVIPVTIPEVAPALKLAA